jgi:hypothetical protein
MENTNKTVGKNTTESIGVTEMQEEMDCFKNHQPSFYDLAEQNGTLIYYQCDSNGNDIEAEDY